jgi:Predicted dehydrogenases and related proteins
VLYGTDGVIHNIGSWHINSERNHEWQKGFTKLNIPADNPFRNELEHFGECLLKGQEPLTSGRDNLKTMAVIEAIYRSAQTQRHIIVADLLGV